MYFTPAAIGYLTQFILALTITAYLTYQLRVGRRQGQMKAHARYVLGIFAATTALTLLLFGDAALPPSTRLYAVYLENTVIGALALCLLQFAYAFPQRYPQRRWEARLALAVSLAYTLWEAGFALYRGRLLLMAGTVIYRPAQPDTVLAALFVYLPLALLRQTVAAASDQSAWGVLWRPANRAARATRTFALILLLPLLLSLLNIARARFYISPAFYQSSMSAGLLLTQFLFVLTYLNALPTLVSFQVRLVGSTLAALLAMFGAVGWVLTPLYAAQYRPAWLDQHTLRFAPNAGGGYDVTSVAFTFDTAVGAPLELRYRWGQTPPEGNAAIQFAFPFYGRRVETLYAMRSGAVGMGTPLDYKDMEYHYATAPAIFPLFVVTGGETSGVFARATEMQLTLTWQDLAYRYKTDAPSTYTYQLVLDTTGVFTITTNGVSVFPYVTDASPYDNIWVQGATPGWKAGPPQPVNFAAAPLVGGPAGILQDHYLEFRAYLHRFLSSLAWLIVGSSLAILVGFPALFSLVLGRPLALLLAGVRRVRAGDLETPMAVQYYDEIGFLTEAFNAMLAQLRGLVNELEMRVAARTQALADANAQLRAEMDERAAAESQLAALAERERLSRELHDGLGQVLGYINVEAQATQALLRQGLTAEAQANLMQLTEAAREAHANVRANILGLRSAAPSSQDLATAVRARLTQFSAASGVAATLSWPPDAPAQPFPPTVEEQVLRILQEALANVRKHARAQRVEVVFSFSAAQAQVMISDDGVGFDASERISESANQRVGASASSDQQPVTNFGLTMMQERAAQIGGQLEVRSAPGAGTRVLFTAPRQWAAPVGDDAAALRGWRVLLADDSRLFLNGLRNLLSAHGLTVVGMAVDGLEAQALARSLRPDLILMDAQMPRCDGLTALRAIKAELPTIQVVMLTVAEDEETLFEALRSGAAGYLLKSLDANEFTALLLGLTRGETPLAPGLAARVLTEFSRAASAAENGELTTRQWEILNLAAAGYVYKEIAVKLNVAESTVKYHMGQILTRLQLNSRAEAIAYVRGRRSG